MRDPVAGTPAESARQVPVPALAPDMSSLYYRVVQSSLATTIHDGSGALVLFNSACTDLLGYDASELSVLPSSTILLAEDADALADATARANAGLDAVVHARMHLVHKSGHPILVDMALRRLFVEHRRYLIVESSPVAHTETAPAATAA